MHTGRQVGYGYRGKNLNKELKSVIEEQKVIKQVKLLRMEGFSLRGIAKLLNEADTPTKEKVASTDGKERVER